MPRPTTNDEQTQQATTTTGVVDTVVDAIEDYVDEDQPAGIVGAAFFGGNKQKEEFYDADAERQARGLARATGGGVSYYHRMDDRTAFGDDAVAALATSLQTSLNTATSVSALKDSSVAPPSSISLTNALTVAYAETVEWQSPFVDVGSASLPTNTKNNPLTELARAAPFYRHIHVAVVAGQTIQSSNDMSTFELQWEISVQWPALWEPRIVLTGKSILTTTQQQQQQNEYIIADTTTPATNANANAILITKQVDTLDSDLLFPTIAQQFFPRFWDMYHIGMTPAAEIRIPKPVRRNGWAALLPFASSYSVVEYPRRLALQPAMVDGGTREDASAALLPNHAFGCVITTMGPAKQRYTPACGVQVQLLFNKKRNDNSIQTDDQNEEQQQLQLQNTKDGAITLEWNIPVATEFATTLALPVPATDDSETDPMAQATCRYVVTPVRRVATMSYGGGPQDADISAVRQRLYEQAVVRDGLEPLLDESGRPIFFFAMNSVKACYTEEGLGMAVYEWRPQFTKPNEVGLELKVD